MVTPAPPPPRTTTFFVGVGADMEEKRTTWGREHWRLSVYI
jgi:hypothetical protein